MRKNRKVSNLYLSFCNKFRYIGEKLLKIQKKGRWKIKEDNFKPQQRKQIQQKLNCRGRNNFKS